MLFADDAGYADFGFQEQVSPDMATVTPHIDSIAAAGVTCRNAYMSGCVCSPSRAGLLVGRYQTRFGHEHNIPPGYLNGGLPLEERTLPDRLGALGYATGLVGKWHLGYPPAYHPNERGFDWFHGLLQGARKYFPDPEITPHRVIQENGVTTPEEGYVTDRFGAAAVRFIETHRDEPFFLFVSFTAPHGPLQAKPSDLEALSSIEGERRRQYAGLVKAMDDNVGLILEALRQQDLDQRTLVLFTNDNGGQTQTGARNKPLRGRKGMLLEGGIRVPLCMRWPGRIPEGTTLDDPVIALDLLPTFVALAGGTVDPEWKLDGVNLLPRITGGKEQLPERPLFWRKGGPEGEMAVRLGRWKLHVANRGEGTPANLYDLGEDLGEEEDLAAAHPEVVAKLQALWKEWESEQVLPLWQYRASSD